MTGILVAEDTAEWLHAVSPLIEVVAENGRPIYAGHDVATALACADWELSRGRLVRIYGLDQVVAA